MTTPYAISSHLGSQSYSGYLHAPIVAPLSTHQTPCAMPYHSYGTLVGIRPTPPQFVSDPPYSSMNVNARRQYLRTAISQTVKAQQQALGKMSVPQSHVIHSSQRQVPVSSHTNYVPPLPSSLYVNVVKANAVGQSAYKVGLPMEAPISTKNVSQSSVRSSLRRARSSGSVAPRKKGAVPASVGGWGSIARSTY